MLAAGEVIYVTQFPVSFIFYLTILYYFLFGFIAILTFIVNNIYFSDILPVKNVDIRFNWEDGPFPPKWLMGTHMSHSTL